jgi:hypothetical protein
MPRARIMAKSPAGRSIKNPIVVGTVLAGRTETFSGALTKHRPTTFYELYPAPSEMVQTDLSVQKGAALFSIMGESGQLIKSLSLSRAGTANWTFGPGTYYLKASHSGKATTGYQFSFAAASDTAVSALAPKSTSVFGEALSFTATVRALAPAATAPEGAVTFMDGSSTLGTETLDANGTATLSTSSLTAGNHSITVLYSGNGSFNPSASSALTQAVSPPSSATALAVDQNPAVFGQAVTLTARVSTVGPGSGIPAGAVTFMDGSTSLSTESLDGTGTATFKTSALGAGSHTITAIYAGNGSLNTSTSPPLSQSVTAARTATALAVNANPSVFGHSMTFTASVSVLAPGGGIPTGNVSFLDGSTPLGTEPLDSDGTAAITTSALAAGTHSITAVYNNTGNFQTSTSPALGQVVHAASTTTAVAVPADPFVYGQAVAFTARVSVVAPGSGVPTGAVNLMDGATPLGTESLDGSGIAKFTIAGLPAGSHAITAVYGGTASFNVSTSSVLALVVNPASTTTALAVGVNPSAYGQPMTFTASVATGASSNAIPAGTVIFLDGSSPLDTESLDGSGTATFTTSALATGSHAITAIFQGDANFDASSSTALSLAVDQATTTTNVSVNVNPAVYGQPLTFTVSVSAAAPGSGIPTGLVNLTAVAQDGSHWSGIGPIDATGTAAFSPFLAAASYSITAAYLGDSNFQPSVSTTTVTTVSSAETTVQLTPSVSPIAYQVQSVNFTASVSAKPPGAGMPTGTVQFQIDGADFGAPVVLVNGTATSAPTSALSLGGHTITAIFVSDGSNFQSSTAPSLPVSVDMTQQQVAANLEAQIKQSVIKFDTDATAIEAILGYTIWGGTYGWRIIDPLLAAVDAETLAGNYAQAFQDIVQPPSGLGLGPALLAEAAEVAALGLPRGDALLGYANIVTDLQNLGAFKEITYGFLVYLAIALGSTATSSPSAWTTGVLGPNTSGSFLSPTDQAIMNNYSSADIGIVTTAMGNVDPSYGLLDPTSQFDSAASGIFADQSINDTAPSYPEFSSDEASVF